ncbi:MAG: 16S rRNA (cytosine(1402)-N(4))-methyltransferase RsmH [Chloroherpetonaceae bacterium]|nr:16S rRNA (cytosine(1402)-N(4))-methyltransferase RsmH [Chloroherpetonaceae bacterium]MDW8437647.1 16S rRNA (cytosine(1402)-N(4))-methyltransferase RsmH [Chloroherpetonaceae bacterium]
MRHAPALLNETTEALVRSAGLYIDGTLGDGGHSEAILKRLAQNGWLDASFVIGIDRDDEALRAASERLKGYKNFRAEKANFSELARYAKENEACGVLLDLGVSSRQIDEGERGFSFQKSARLDMRMNQAQSLSAWEVVNQSSEEKLAEILWKYGEEKKSRRIAKRIAERRRLKPIETTSELADIVKACAPKGEQIKTLARVFQAIRIEVNDELGELERALPEALKTLRSGGRIAVISYHSLEDRIAKDFFREQSQDDWGYEKGLKGLPLKEPLRKATMKLVTKKPIEPSEKEINENPRARSAKLRVAEKL